MDDTAREASAAADRCVLIRRQAIFDPQERVSGYELLLDTGAPPAEDEQAQGLLTSAVVDIGLRRIVGTRRAYLTATPALLADAAALRLSPEQVVLLVPAQPVGRSLLRTLRGLVGAGFEIGVGAWAIDGGAEPLLRLASVVKLDFRFGTRELALLMTRRDELHARGATLIAGQVQTWGEYERCLGLGFDAFQGEYLAHPAPIDRRRRGARGRAPRPRAARVRGARARDLRGRGARAPLPARRGLRALRRAHAGAFGA